ncbi:Fic family protein [bacterium]|nr:Fic family protein [bacterium]
MLTGADNYKRLNNLNWIRSQLSVEAECLFQYPDYMPKKEKKQYVDYSNLKNLGTAWDYIVENTNDVIDNFAIKEIHKILCVDSDIPGGLYRLSDAYIEQLGVHAPAYAQLLYRMDDIQYRLQNESMPIVSRAINAHFDIIASQPFNDFNKRTARLVMNWFLIQNGYQPILFNRKTDKVDYMAALRSRAHNDCRRYSAYMYAAMQRTQKDILALLKKARVL